MDHPIVPFIISDSMHRAYSFIGYNILFGSSHLMPFSDNDISISNTIRFYRHFLVIVHPMKIILNVLFLHNTFFFLSIIIIM